MPVLLLLSIFSLLPGRISIPFSALRQGKTTWKNESKYFFILPADE